MPVKKKKFKPTSLQILLLCAVIAVSFSCNKSILYEEPPFDPEASLSKANDLINDGYYENAREILEEIAAKDATRQYGTLARLRIADTYFEDELFDEAALEYQNFLGVHTHHKYAPYAQFKLAMTFFNRIKTVDVSSSWAKAAIREFEKLRRNYPRNPYMDITESKIKTCKRILSEYEFYVGSFYYDKGAYEAAVNRFVNMLKAYPESKMESEALYYLGLSYEGIGQRSKALSTLSMLIEKYPTIKLANEAREALDQISSKPGLIINE